MKTILKTGIEMYEGLGWTVVDYIDGIASLDRHSRTGRAIIELKEKHPDIEYRIVVGARKRYVSQGTENAIMARIKK